jgi:hypothetical protein
LQIADLLLRLLGAQLRKTEQEHGCRAWWQVRRDSARTYVHVHKTMTHDDRWQGSLASKPVHFIYALNGAEVPSPRTDKSEQTDDCGCTQPQATAPASRTFLFIFWGL